MDCNKLIKLKEIGYVVKKTCGTCRFAELSSGRSFGACLKHDYVHSKHSGPSRSLSINANGWCSGYEPHDVEMAKLHRFSELLEG